MRGRQGVIGLFHAAGFYTHISLCAQSSAGACSSTVAPGNSPSSSQTKAGRRPLRQDRISSRFCFKVSRMGSVSASCGPACRTPARSERRRPARCRKPRRAHSGMRFMRAPSGGTSGHTGTDGTCPGLVPFVPGQTGTPPYRGVLSCPAWTGFLGCPLPAPGVRDAYSLGLE